MSEGSFLVVSAASGAGKSTMIARLLADPVAGRNLGFSVSHTTRAPRPGESPGREYHFVSKEEFLALRDADGFLESAEVHGNLYGTSRKEVESRLAAGLDMLLDIDVQGARQVVKKRPDAVTIMIFPPSKESLEARLRGRATDSDPVIARRLAVAAREMAAFVEYDYVIINDDLEVAVDELRSIVVARRAHRNRRRGRLEEILRTF